MAKSMWTFKHQTMYIHILQTKHTNNMKQHMTPLWESKMLSTFHPEDSDSTENSGPIELFNTLLTLINTSQQKQSTPFSLNLSPEQPNKQIIDHRRSSLLAELTASFRPASLFQKGKTVSCGLK